MRSYGFPAMQASMVAFEVWRLIDQATALAVWDKALGRLLASVVFPVLTVYPCGHVHAWPAVPLAGADACFEFRLSGHRHDDASATTAELPDRHCGLVQVTGRIVATDPRFIRQPS
jgi:hypothetical protein